MPSICSQPNGNPGRHCGAMEAAAQGGALASASAIFVNERWIGDQWEGPDL